MNVELMIDVLKAVPSVVTLVLLNVLSVFFSFLKLEYNAISSFNFYFGLKCVLKFFNPCPADRD